MTSQKVLNLVDKLNITFNEILKFQPSIVFVSYAIKILLMITDYIHICV